MGCSVRFGDGFAFPLIMCSTLITHIALSTSCIFSWRSPYTSEMDSILAFISFTSASKLVEEEDHDLRKLMICVFTLSFLLLLISSHLFPLYVMLHPSQDNLSCLHMPGPTVPRVDPTMYSYSVTYLVLQGFHLLLFGWLLGSSSRWSPLGRARVGLHIPTKDEEE